MLTVQISVAALLWLGSLATAQGTKFTCSSTPRKYTAIITSVGCFNSSGGNPLGSQEKLSSIVMTPQVCGDFCGAKGYKYSGIQPGASSECFCGPFPSNSASIKVDDSKCKNPCFIDAKLNCGGNGGLMSIAKISNPVGSLSSSPDPFVPVCHTSPLCSQKICDTSLSLEKRVASLVKSLTTEEKIVNLVNSAAGAPRIGLPAYQWWNEALHGVGQSPGVNFPNGDDFNYATSFPSPILTASSFNDKLVYQVASVIGKEARAFANYQFAGLDFWTPNINTFRDPRWGRGQETPGEDSFHTSSYTKQVIPGLQGPNADHKQIIATCKHYAAYDVETARYANNYNPTQQDLADYYLAPFKTCVRDVDVGSVMCAYNSVNGVPSCASEFLLDDVLRHHWNFTADYKYVVSDCGAVSYIYDSHNFTDTIEAAASVALNAGTDLECGFPGAYFNLTNSLAKKQTTVATLDRSLTRLYLALFTVGYFDGNHYSNLNFADVGTSASNDLAYTAAVEGITLLKNDGILPIEKSRSHSKVALIGPYANATRLLQGNYFGDAKHVVSPLEAFKTKWDQVSYSKGAAINSSDTTGFAPALSAGRKSDIIFFFGGIDNTIETEGLDRKTIVWPENQLKLITQLSKLGKPLVVVQLGGGQVDDTELLKNSNVNAIVWAGYPGQAGGTAILDIVTGKKSVAGRLPVTQYPASYADDVSIFDISLRPDASRSFPGRTYKWYTGDAVLPFGYGLQYTTFSASWECTLQRTYNIQQIVGSSCTASSSTGQDIVPFQNVTVRVKNTGKRTSDYVGLLFISSPNSGPKPRPIKSLVSYARAHDIQPNSAQNLELPLTLGSLARADEHGSLVIYPGDYTLALDIDARLTFKFSLTGKAVVIDTLPAVAAEYKFTVPVHIQPPSTNATGRG